MRIKWSSITLCFVTLLFLSPSIYAQGAVHTADRWTQIQAGAGLLYLNPDYAQNNIKGLSGWADYDFLKYHFGIEASVHIGTIITPDDIGESSYMVGPRFIYHRRKFTGYGKLLYGRATITNQDYNLSSSYNAYAFGAGVEYRVARKVNIRIVDVEFQQWPSFYPNTLSPMAITFGASYIIR